MKISCRKNETMSPEINLDIDPYFSFFFGLRNGIGNGLNSSIATVNP